MSEREVRALLRDTLISHGIRPEKIREEGYLEHDVPTMLAMIQFWDDDYGDGDCDLDDDDLGDDFDDDV